MLAAALATNKEAKIAIDHESIRLERKPAFEGLMVTSRF